MTNLATVNTHTSEQAAVKAQSADEAETSCQLWLLQRSMLILQKGSLHHGMLHNMVQVGTTAEKYAQC